MSEETSKPTRKRRHSDGGTYLVIADDTPEYTIALDYAVHMARLHHGHVALARIIEPADFIGWGAIEAAARAEAREKAERELQTIAARVKEESGVIPTLILREGDRPSEVVAIANGNPALTAVVLGASAVKGAPGPLVSYFLAKGITRISVPVIIVPGHMDKAALERLR